MTTHSPIEAASLASHSGKHPGHLQVEKVTKRFQQGDTAVEALRDVSLTVNEGEFVAIMGASGCGKSTLLHVMAGLTSADRGRVCVDGVDLSSLNDGQLTRFRRERIGLIFQAFNLIPSLSAEDNITLPLLAARRSGANRERLERLLDRLELAPRRRHRPDALSGGEQQRVAVARALVTDPAVVLGDEPTGSLDSISGQCLCRLLGELHRDERRTIVVVTHEPAVAACAERVLVMKDGCILAEFRTSECPDAPLVAARYLDIVRTAAAQDYEAGRKLTCVGRT
jgi:putative ABC transport system ATP-binding protein